MHLVIMNLTQNLIKVQRGITLFVLWEPQKHDCTVVLQSDASLPP